MTTYEERAAKRAYYQRTKEERLARQRAYYRRAKERRLAYQRERVAGRRELLDRVKREAGCADCGTKIGALHFDHVDPSTKEFHVSEGHRYAWAAVLAEIEKCAVRCAACHSKRHAAP